MPMKKEIKESAVPPSRLYRSESGKMIAGVCAGLGDFFNIDPTIIRIVFVILTFFQGSGLLIYILLWILIPAKSRPGAINEASIKENVEEIKGKAVSIAHNIRGVQKTGEDQRFWWALLIIILGFFFLFRNFGILDAIDLSRYWPVILIILGLGFLLKK